MSKSKSKSDIINHILFVIDKSGSMGSLRDDVVKVFDGQIAQLAKQSQQYNQETRVTVFFFDYSTNIECIIYDKDVLRLPSLAGLYRPGGQTALIDATLQAISDLRETPEKHGDHAFLTYVITDGAENDSKHSAADLRKVLKNLPENWTMAVMVPDSGGANQAETYGFLPGNIAQWDASAAGLEKAIQRISKATETFMTGRATGKRSMTGVFTMDLSKVSKAAVKGALTEVAPSSYQLIPVPAPASIRDFVESNTGRTYAAGMAFYQLTKPETIQDYKNAFVREKSTGKVYGGDSARQVLGLPDASAKITPHMLGQFDVFIQSTSFNRKLMPGTQLLVLTA